jgi:hypothetical protein
MWNSQADYVNQKTIAVVPKKCGDYGSDIPAAKCMSLVHQVHSKINGKYALTV